MVIIQSIENLNRTKQNKTKKEGLNSLSARLLSWDIGLLLPLGWDSHCWCSLFSGLRTWTGIYLYHQLFCFSGPSDLHWNYTIGSPGSGLLSLHKCVSQLLRMYELYMFIYVWVCIPVCTCALVVFHSFIHHLKTYIYWKPTICWTRFNMLE